MTIKKATTLINSIIIFTILVTVLAVINLIAAATELEEANEQRNTLLMLGEELSQSSRDLTLNVRLYAVTGDPRYEAAYNEVLDERAGKAPRDSSKRLFPGEHHVLLDLIRQYGIADEEMAHVRRAEELSNGLVPLEVEAMYLVKGLHKDAGGAFTVKGEPDTARATQLVFGADYFRQLAPISAEMQQFTTRLNNRTTALVKHCIERMNTARDITLVCLAVILGAALFAAWYNIRTVSGPLGRTTQFAHSVASGNFEHHIDITSKNEIGFLGNTLNFLVDNLKRRKSEIEKAMQQASAKEQEALHAAETANEASREARQRQEHMLNVALHLEEMSAVVNSVVEAISARIVQAERGATEQAGRMAQTATSMEEMNSTVLEVARNAGSAAEMSASARARADVGASVVRQAVDSISDVQRLSMALKADMVTLGENAISIDAIMAVISDIADQTNLLALNAAIEAARAGEAGRGFAVVADEVRKLAEKTVQSTAHVGNAIRAIQHSAQKSIDQVDQTVKNIEQATGFASQSGTALVEIVSMVDRTADQVRAIATASEQQSASSEEITRSISQVNDIAGNMARAMSEASKAVTDLDRQAFALSALIADMRKE